MVFYLENFEDSDNYPVAYAAAVNTGLIAFLASPLSARLERAGVVDFSLGEFSVGWHLSGVIALYIANLVFLTVDGRWKRYLRDFRSLPPRSQAITNWCTLSVAVFAVIWLVAELVILH